MTSGRNATSEGAFVIEFIERHCCLTKGTRAGERVHLLQWQKDLITDLFALDVSRRRYRRAYVQMARKNGKTFLMACVALYEAVVGEMGGEVYFVAGDRMQASRAFGEIRKIAEADDELRGLFTFYKHAAEIPSSGTVLRVLSADAGLQLGLEPSFTVFDEVAVQPNDRLWNAMSLGSGSREHPMLVGISTPGWERDSLAYKLYMHGKKIDAGEIEDPTFYFKAYEPSDVDADHTDPKVWAEANPSLGAFLHAEDFAAALASTDENEFRRFRLGQWTATHSVAFTSGVWDAAKDRSRATIPEGTDVVVAFVAARKRDAVAIVGCTVDDPHIFPIKIWEDSNRVDPNDVAEELRDVWRRYDVRDLVCSQRDWSWVLLSLAEEGLPVAAVPRSPQRLASEWQVFFDAVTEKRVTHDGDPVLARHVGNLSLISGPSGPRPDLDVAEGQPVAAALAAIIAFDTVARFEPAADLRVILPSWVESGSTPPEVVG
ncbi:MAG TPA: terminase large subunit [Actinomycetota bacterium]|nr:terminase large subunit [Actinomycetota bacterium]